MRTFLFPRKVIDQVPSLIVSYKATVHGWSRHRESPLRCFGLLVVVFLNEHTSTKGEGASYDRHERRLRSKSGARSRSGTRFLWLRTSLISFLLAESLQSLSNHGTITEIHGFRTTHTSWIMTKSLMQGFQPNWLMDIHIDASWAY